jgi:hypothetical protein
MIGSAVTLAASAWFSSESAPPPLRAVTNDGVIFEPWLADDESLWDGREEPRAPECTFWNHTVQFESPLCSHFSLSRMSSSVHSRATSRALRCAAHHETECVLSPEIGVAIPAAFTYDHAGQTMRMLIAPRFLEHESERRRVRLQDPGDESMRGSVELNHSVRVEFLPGGSRAPAVEVLAGAESYCVQLLRMAFGPACWAALD